MISKVGDEIIKDKSKKSGKNNTILKALGLNREQAEALKKQYGLESDNEIFLNNAGRKLTGNALGLLPGTALMLLGQKQGRMGRTLGGLTTAIGGSILGSNMAAKRYSAENADNIIKGEKEDINQKHFSNFANSVEGLAGAALASNALKSGELTGRQTLYHGTTRDAVKGIKEKGLLPTTDENAINTKVLKADPERYSKSLGKAYLSPERADALQYALQSATNRGRNKENWKNMGVAKVNAPIWKMKTVVNPEVDMPFEKWKDTLGLGGMFTSESEKQFMYKNMRNAVVVDGGVGPEYVKGSDKYQRLTLKELGEYIKARPKTFALGAAKTLGGLGMLGHGAYHVYDRVKQK